MSKEEIIHKANVERAFVATVMQALDSYITNMINNCKKVGLSIEPFERSQLNIMQKAIRNITIDYR